MAKTRPRPKPKPAKPNVPPELREVFVENLYWMCLDREPEDGAIESWLPYFGPNGEPDQVIMGIVVGPEAKGLQVRRIYLELLDREPTAAELKKWVEGPEDVMVIRWRVAEQFPVEIANVVFEDE